MTDDFLALARMAREAEEREAAERQQAERQQLERAAGSAYLAFDGVLKNDDLTHEEKVARYNGATSLLRGESVTAATVTSAPPSANADTLDLSSLRPEARRVIEMVVADQGRFTIEMLGDEAAVKDRQYPRLRREQQAAQAASSGDSSQGSGASSATVVVPPAPETSAPAKKAVAKKAAASSSEAAPSEQQEETGDKTGSESVAQKMSGFRRVGQSFLDTAFPKKG